MIPGGNMRKIYPKHKKGSTLIFLCLFLCLCIIAFSFPLYAAQQNIIIKPGWNLISIQVEPADPKVEAVFSDWIDSGFSLSVWEYDGEDNIWRIYYSPGQEHSSLNTIPELSVATIMPKKGYWINSGFFTDHELVIEGEPSTGVIYVKAGWNLMGFTGLNSETFGEMSIENIMAAKKSLIEEIWFYHRGFGEGYRCYLTDGSIRDFSTIVPGRAYWIKANADFTLAPELGVTLEADIDLPPLRHNITFPGPEDEDFGDDGYDDGQTQQYISFRDQFESRYISVSNPGEGILNWELLGIDEIEWLGADLISGTTTTETDIITLGASRDGLLPGDYEGNITIRGDEGSKQITVLLNVPSLDGDYQGTAKIYLVNGRPADVADVDLYLRLFEDGQGKIRGLIDKGKTVLFPVDIHLSGYIFQGTNRNVIRGKYCLDSGPDALNPFPFAIEREVTLTGERSSNNTIEGKYQETILNPLSHPIVAEGGFVLTRIGSITPFTYNDSPDKAIDIPDMGQVQREIMITDAFLIDEVNAQVKIDHLYMADLIVSLTSPDNDTVVLHDHQTGINLDTVYDTLTFPLPANALDAFTGKSSFGIWTLTIEDTVSGYAGKLREWGLEITGAPSFSISGTIKDNQGNNLSGVRVSLYDGQVIKTIQTASDGNYLFPGLGVGDYKIDVRKIGYQRQTQLVRLSTEDITLEDIILSPFEPDIAGLMAAPIAGNKDLRVEFAVIAPSGMIQPGATYSWYFGDDTQKDTTTPFTDHLYTQAGFYTVTVLIFDSTKTIFLTAINKPNLICVYEVPDGTPSDDYWIFSHHFSGGGMAGNVFTEAANDCAAFDIDRPPYRPLGESIIGPEDTDYNNNGKYDISDDPKRFRMVTNIGGLVSGVGTAGDTMIFIGLRP